MYCHLIAHSRRGSGRDGCVEIDRTHVVERETISGTVRREHVDMSETYDEARAGREQARR